SRKEKHADLVPRHLRRAGQHTADLGDDFALELVGGPEVPRARGIDNQKQAQFALLLELLGQRIARTGADFPVDVADVVARDVKAVLRKLHALSLEMAAVLAAHEIFDPPSRRDFKEANLAENLIG